MLGATAALTVRMAASLVSSPAALLTIQRNVAPSSTGTVAGVVYVAPVASDMSNSSLCH